MGPGREGRTIPHPVLSLHLHLNNGPEYKISANVQLVQRVKHTWPLGANKATSLALISTKGEIPTCRYSAGISQKCIVLSCIVLLFNNVLLFCNGLSKLQSQPPCQSANARSMINPPLVAAALTRNPSPFPKSTRLLSPQTKAPPEKPRRLQRALAHQTP